MATERSNVQHTLITEPELYTLVDEALSPLVPRRKITHLYQLLTEHLNKRIYELSQTEPAFAPVGNSSWGEAYQDGWGRWHSPTSANSKRNI